MVVVRKRLPQQQKKTSFVQYNLGEMWKRSDKLAERIREDDFVPHTIIGLARGGWIIARLLADRFAEPEIVDEMKRDEGGNLVPTGKKVLNVVHPNLLNVGVKHYSEYSVEGADFYQGLPRNNKKIKRDLGRDKNVLVVDDVYDTGITLVDVKNHIRKQGFRPKALKFAVLDYKRGPYVSPKAGKKERQRRFDLRDTADKELAGCLYCLTKLDNRIVDKWVIYPWESKEETLRALLAFDRKDWRMIKSIDPDDANMRRKIKQLKKEMDELRKKEKA